jgi:diguanylate cyclase (GGDEF)-like protein
MRYPPSAYKKALWQIFCLTAVGSMFSVGCTALAMRIVFGDDPAALIPAAQFKHFAYWLSLGLPVVLCPLLSFRFFGLMQRMNVARTNFKILAQTDELTGLFNRRGFDAAALEALETERVAGRPVAVMICDIDHFKRLNDNFGHDFGDQSLMHIACVLTRFAGSHGLIVGRQGGDEFVVMYPGAGKAEAAAVAEAIRLACAEMQLVGSTLSVSIGLAASLRATASLSALIRRADVALYDVKRTTRNSVVAADVEEEWASAA